MNKEWIYSKKTRRWLWMIALFIGFVIGVTLYLTERFEGRLTSIMTKYEDTYAFGEDLQWAVYHELSMAQGRILLEEDGVYNPKKLVNVADVLNCVSIGYQEEWFDAIPEAPVNYYAEDLKRIAEGDYNLRDSYLESENPIIVCRKADGTYQYYLRTEFEEFLKKEEALLLVNGELIDSTRMEGYFENIYGRFDPERDSSSSCMIADKEGRILFVDSWIYQGAVLDGDVAPIGYSSLLDFVNRNKEWNGQLTTLNYCLQEVFQRIMTLHYSEQEEKTESNMTFLYIDQKQKKLISSNPKWNDYSHFTDYLKEIEGGTEEPDRYKFFIYDYKGLSLDTNIRNLKLEFGYQGGKSEEVLAAAIDTAYPVEDQWKDYHDAYAKTSRYLMILVPLVVIGAIALLVILILLTLGTGRACAEDKTIHLTRFDQMKTEIAAVGIFAVWALPMMGMAALADWLLNTAWVRRMSVFWSGTYGLLVVYFILCLLIGYLSLVRRIKAKTLWSNSLTKVLLSKGSVFVGRLGLAWKVAIVLAAGAYIQLEAIFSYYRDIWIFLLFILEVGITIYLLFYVRGRIRLEKKMHQMADGIVETQSDSKMDTRWMLPEQKAEADLLNAISQGMSNAINEKLQSERMKTELITNVSHDLKTPLTSIINYVDLIQKEEIDNPKVQEYLAVLETKSQRLKTLTEDIVEASRASSGNIKLEMTTLDLNEMIRQVEVEFEDRFVERKLLYLVTIPDQPSLIRADGRCLWRIAANLFSNASKYAMPGSRVYAEVVKTGNGYSFIMKNTSEQELNISAEELTERFVRGDRSRLTEGSGLGLSIAKSLAELQGGTLKITIDGDLFRAELNMQEAGTETHEE